MPEVIDSFSGEYSFLSNFYVPDIPIFYAGHPWRTSEHAFQAAKFVYAGAEAHVAIVQDQEHPRNAKRQGRAFPARPDWDAQRISVMAGVLEAKFDFDHHLELTMKLLRTGDAKLIEGNTWNDTFWGVCNGHGKNHLGKALMEVRALLQAEVSQDVDSQPRSGDSI